MITTDNDLLNNLQAESLNLYNKAPSANPHHRKAEIPSVPKNYNMREDVSGTVGIDGLLGNSINFTEEYDESKDSAYELFKQQIKDRANTKLNTEVPIASNFTSNVTQPTTLPKVTLSEGEVEDCGEDDYIEDLKEDLKEEVYKQKLIEASNLRKASSCRACIFFNDSCSCVVLEVCVNPDDLCNNFISRVEEGNKKRQELLDRFNLEIFEEPKKEDKEGAINYSEDNSKVIPEQITNDSKDINKEDIEGLLMYSDPELWNESVSEIVNLDIPLESKAIRLTTDYINKYTIKYGTKEGAYIQTNRNIS